MATVSVKQARNQLKTILSRAEGGEEVLIARRGKVIARIVPPAHRTRRLPSLKNLRSRIRLRGRPLSATVLRDREEERT